MCSMSITGPSSSISRSSPGFAKSAGAAAERSARVLPLVQGRLAARPRPAPDDHDHGGVHVEAPRPPPGDPAVLVAVADASRPVGHDELTAALATAVVD